MPPILPLGEPETTIDSKQRQGFRVNQPFRSGKWLGGLRGNPGPTCAAEFWRERFTRKPGK